VNRIAGIILAAGSAQRMGEPKQLMIYRDKPLLQHVIDAAEASQLDQVIVVTGASADLVESSIRLTKAVAVRNPDPERGNMSSLAVGAAAASGADGFLLLMGDQPDLPTSIIERMIALWRDRQPWGAVTEYSDRVAHPFLLSASALDEALVVGGPKLLWRFLAEDDTGRVVRLTTEDAASIDVNTPEDFRRLDLQ
jgi:molybdenum cofactor cytidylyltransferase